MQRAHERLRAANPAPVTPIDDRPDAAAFLDLLEPGEIRQPTLRPTPPRWRRGVVVAAAAFATTLLLAGGLWIASLVRSEPEVVDPPPSTTTTVTPTTTTTTSPSTTTTTSTPASTTTTIPPADLEALDEFAARYSAGDVDAFLELAAPGLVRATIRDADPAFVWDDELLRLQLDMDAALNTTLEMRSCRRLPSGTITCLAARDNDLTRIAGVGPQEDRWSLRFEDGVVTSWEIRRAFNETSYEALAIVPFTAWLSVAHPEIPNPYPVAGGVSHWLRDVDIVERTPELVAEYAAAEGVTLP